MKSWKTFASDTRGNVAMMFGLAVVAIFGISGLAIDYSRATTVKAKIAAAADAAALAGAKATGSEKDREKVAEDVFNAAMSTIPGTSKFKLKAKDVKDKGKVTGFKVTASLKLETTVGAVLGQKKLDIGTESQATVGTSEKYEIALVLDTTLSMSGSKMSALKVAAKDLVTKMTGKATEADQVKFAVVPFSQWVNVGLSNRNASWIDVPADYSETKTVDVYTYPDKTLIGCELKDVTSTSDGVTTTTQQNVCTYDYGTPVITPTQKTYNYKWNGCVGSRNYPLNTQDGSYSTKVPGLLNHWCPGEVLPLTSNVSNINSAIDGMSAYGNTYIPSGLAWGWRVLSAGKPYDDTQKGKSKKINQVLILMTDGANSKSAQYPDHWGTNVADANTITSEVCTNINNPATGIKVYTIAFAVTDTTIKSILQACAGNDASRFFDAADSAQLSAAFSKIADSLAQLRLQK